ALLGQDTAGLEVVRQALSESAQAAARTKGTYFASHYAHLSATRTPNCRSSGDVGLSNLARQTRPRSCPRKLNTQFQAMARPTEARPHLLSQGRGSTPTRPTPEIRRSQAATRVSPSTRTLTTSSASLTTTMSAG